MRGSTAFFLLVALEVLALSSLLYFSWRPERRMEEELRVRRTLTEALGLTDLALTTEARYTRHPTMADLTSPFQDHPASLDHFPSGSTFTRPDFTGLNTSIESAE